MFPWHAEFASGGPLSIKVSYYLYSTYILPTKKLC